MLRAVVFTLAVLQAATAGVRLADFARLGSAEAAMASANHNAILNIGQRYERDPVDARVDRVWHAIPGLSGWKLDLQKSIRATDSASDGDVHLVWRRVRPNVSLADLPPQPIYRAPSQEKSAALMFNVSWGEEYVPAILQTLQAKHVKATFFLDGQWVKKHPDLAKEIAAAGHDIGSHGSGHPNFQRLSNGQLAQQISGTNAVLKHTLGVDPVLLAPPAGAYDERTVRLAAQQKMFTILWTVDTVDWRRPAPTAIVARVREHIEPGSLVLMHPTDPTARALPELIDMLRQRGYHFKTVGQVVREEPVLAPPRALSPKS